MDFTKGDEYYANLDKRTREYREYRAYVDGKSKGLGDTVKNVLSNVGITKENLEKLGFDDCGCEERQEKLNRLFRYKRVECLKEDEFIWLKQLFDKNKSRTSVYEQSKMLSIYNRVFHKNKQPSNCSSCIREIRMRLKKLTEAHLNG